MELTFENLSDCIKKGHKAVIAYSVFLVYQGQTQDERNSEETVHSNNIGFNYFDANYGSFLGKIIEENRKKGWKWGWCLPNKLVPSAQKLIWKYRKQVFNAMNTKKGE